MSFTSDVKEDLINRTNNDISLDIMEIEGMLRLSSEISLIGGLSISFTQGQMSIIRKLITLLKGKYDIDYEIESRVVNRLDNHTVYTALIKNAKDIVSDLNLLSMNINFDDKTDEEKIAYLRGAFIVKGSVNDPNSKNSHLEISSSSDTEIILIQKLMNYFELNARISKRGNIYIAYLKSKEVIGDFLYLIGVTKKMEYYEDVIITKEIMTSAKRSINLDIANQNKTNKASLEQLETINYLENNYHKELDPKLQLVIKIRKENPESSLNELLDIIHDNYDSTLTKSGLNHRFRRLKELEEETKRKKNQ